VNPAATLVGVNKHFCRRRRSCQPSGEAKQRQQRLRSDRGDEYFPIFVDEFCAEHGIIHERTPLYSPESNGIAERKTAH
jgi:transposase InsO family protein